MDTGGFEVVSDAKKDLALQIKTAMRAQKRTPRIYKVAKKHSFIDIPLIPIDNSTEADNVEINTSFTVMVGPHYANMSVQYTAIFLGCKNDNFQMKFFDFFLIFAQNIDCGYTLEPS